MPSSLLELIKQQETTPEPSQQAAASGSSGARSIILTFPGLPSCCTEIIINFEDMGGTDPTGSKTEESKPASPAEDRACHERSAKCQKSKPDEETVHEFDQNTVYIGLDSSLSAPKKKTGKKTDSLVRTLPILAKCSKRWLNFRGKKSNERGRVCAFESGDVGKVNKGTASVEDGAVSVTEKFDNTQRFLSSRSPFAFLKPKPTSSTVLSYGRKKSPERNSEINVCKYSSRKSKSGGGISETKEDIVRGENVEKCSAKRTFTPSAEQLKMDELFRSKEANWKSNENLYIDASGSLEKAQQYLTGKCSEIKTNRDKVTEIDDKNRFIRDGIQLRPETSQHGTGSVPYLSSPRTNAKATAHATLDTMFVDVIKLLIEQEVGPHVQMSTSLSEDGENQIQKADGGQASSRQVTQPNKVSENYEVSSSDDMCFIGSREPGEKGLNRPPSGAGLRPSHAHHWISLAKANSLDQSRDSQAPAANADSNNCHLCCGGETNGCKELSGVGDDSSPSEESFRESLGSRRDLLSSDVETTFDPLEGGSKPPPYKRGITRYLQMGEQSVSDDNEKEGEGRNSHKLSVHPVVPDIVVSSESILCSSENIFSDFRDPDANRRVSNWDVSEESLLKSATMKTNDNVLFIQKEKDTLEVDSPTALIVSMAKTKHVHAADSCCLDTATADRTGRYNIMLPQNCSEKYLCNHSWKKMALENEEANTAERFEADTSALSQEVNIRSSDNELFIVSVKSSKLHPIFSRSSDNSSVDSCRHGHHAVPRTTRSSRMDGNQMANTEVEIRSKNVGACSKTWASNCDQPKEDGGIDYQSSLRSPSDKITPLLLPRPRTSEKSDRRKGFASFFLVKAKTALSNVRSRSLAALSNVRSRSLSPADLSSKINALFGESGSHIGASKPGASSRQRQSLDPEKNSKSANISGQSELRKQKVTSRCSKQKQKTSSNGTWNKCRQSPNVTSQASLHQVANSSVVRNTQISLPKSTLLPGHEISKPNEEQIKRHLLNLKNVSVPGKSNVRTKETGLNSTWCPTEILESASSNDSLMLDRDLNEDLLGKSGYHHGGLYSGIEPTPPASTPFMGVISIGLEPIAEAESPCEESKADEETTQRGGQWIVGSQSLAEVTLHVFSWGDEVSSPPAGCRYKRGRMLVPRASSSYEDCKRESGDRYRNGCLPSPMKTLSLVSTREISEPDMQAINVMAMLSPEVHIKRYPSFPNLTDINDDEVPVPSENTPKSNVDNVKDDRFEIDSTQQTWKPKVTNSHHPVDFTSDNPETSSNNCNDSEILLNRQTGFSLPQIVQAYVKIPICAESHTFKIPGSRVTPSAMFVGNGNRCGGALTQPMDVITFLKVKLRTTENSADMKHNISSFSHVGTKQNVSLSQFGTKQNVSLSQAGTKQGVSLSQAGTKQDVSLSQAGTKQNVSLSQAGTKQDVSLFQADTKQDVSLSQASTKQNVSLSQAVTKRDVWLFQAGPKQNVSLSQSGTKQSISLSQSVTAVKNHENKVNEAKRVESPVSIDTAVLADSAGFTKTNQAPRETDADFVASTAVVADVIDQRSVITRASIPIGRVYEMLINFRHDENVAETNVQENSNLVSDFDDREKKLWMLQTSLLYNDKLETQVLYNDKRETSILYNDKLEYPVVYNGKLETPVFYNDKLETPVVYNDTLETSILYNDKLEIPVLYNDKLERSILCKEKLGTSTLYNDVSERMSKLTDEEFLKHGRQSPEKAEVDDLTIARDHFPLQGAMMFDSTEDSGNMQKVLCEQEDLPAFGDSLCIRVHEHSCKGNQLCQESKFEFGAREVCRCMLKNNRMSLQWDTTQTCCGRNASEEVRVTCSSCSADAIIRGVKRDRHSSSVSPIYCFGIEQSNIVSPSCSSGGEQSSSASATCSSGAEQSSIVSPSCSSGAEQSSIDSPSCSSGVEHSSSVSPMCSSGVERNSSVSPTCSSGVEQSSNASSTYSSGVEQSRIVSPTCSSGVEQSSNASSTCSSRNEQSCSAFPTCSSEVEQSSNASPSCSSRVEKSNNIFPSFSPEVEQNSTASPACILNIEHSEVIGPAAANPVTINSLMANTVFSNTGEATYEHIGIACCKSCVDNSDHVDVQISTDNNIMIKTTVARVFGKGTAFKPWNDMVKAGWSSENISHMNIPYGVVRSETPYGLVEKSDVDICNSCLSDLESEYKDGGYKNATASGQISTAGTMALVSSKISKKTNTKRNINNRCLLSFAENKTKLVKSESMLFKAAKVTKHKQDVLYQESDISVIADNEALFTTGKNINNAVCKSKFKTIDVDTINTSQQNNQFMITRASSIFGAPDKIQWDGYKFVENLAGVDRFKVKSQTLTTQAETILDNHLDMLNKSRQSYTSASNLYPHGCNLKIRCNKLESLLETFDSQTQKDFTAHNAQESICDLPLHSSPTDSITGVDQVLGIQKLDNSSEAEPQTRLGHIHLCTPEHVLSNVASCSGWLCNHSTSGSSAVQSSEGVIWKPLSDRMQRRGQRGTTRNDFAIRGLVHQHRFDAVVQRSAEAIRRSQEMSCRVQKQMEYTADKMAAMCHPGSRELT